MSEIFTNEIEENSERELSEIYIWIRIIHYSILVVVNLFIGVLVIIIRKRKDCFVVTTLTCLFIPNCLFLINDIGSENYWIVKEVYWAIFFGYFIYFTAHQAFSA